MIPASVQKRQAASLKEWHRYLVGRFALEARTALEVGAGAGYVMRNLSDLLEIKGIDIDPGQVRLAGERGLDVERMDGLNMSFPDRSFDLVYCSFYLMWVRDMEKALREMIRISKGPVLVMSEPIWERSLYSPEGVWDMISAQRLLIKHRGGDPEAGTSLVRTLRRIAPDSRFGIVPAEMTFAEMDDNVGFEYEYVLGKGFEVEALEADLFTVPFVWAFLPGPPR